LSRELRLRSKPRVAWGAYLIAVLAGCLLADAAVDLAHELGLASTAVGSGGLTLPG
jgi:hypothetical protein